MRCQHLSELVQPNEGCLIAHLQLLLEPDRCDALQGICEVGDKEKQVPERQLPACKTGPRGCRKLPLAIPRFAFPLLTGADRVDFAMAATRAEWLAIVFGEADRDELSKCLFVRQALNALCTQGTCCRGEKEMLRLCLRCVKLQRSKNADFRSWSTSLILTYLVGNQQCFGQLTGHVFSHC